MIKILHCVSKMDRAGQEVFIMNVFRNIDRSKYHFSFLCTNNDPGDFDNDIRELGGDIFYLPEPQYGNGIRKYKEKIELLKEWFISNKEKFDIVHLHTYHALDVFVHLVACRKAGCKRLVVHSHNTSGQHVFLHCCFRVFDNFFNFTRFACAYDAGEWLYGKHKMKEGSVKIIYNGIRPNDYRYFIGKSWKIRKELQLEGKTVIGHIGRFSQQKNHDFLLDVFHGYNRINPESVLLLIGKGELLEHIKEKAKKLSIQDKVMFLGTREDISDLLSAMDLMVFPSLHEGLSVVLVEAQASGLKCIISDNILPTEECIIPELFTKLNISERPQTWANEIDEVKEKIIDREECCEKMIDSPFNIIRTVKQMEDEYEEIMQKK